MRIRSTDDRERLWEQLRETTGHGHTSQALDDAARYYVRMHGHTAVGKGKLRELMIEAATRGSLTAPEIAEILDAPELPVEADTSFSVGRVD